MNGNIATKLLKISQLCQDVAEEVVRNDSFVSRAEELEFQVRSLTVENHFLTTAIRMFFTSDEHKEWARQELLAHICERRCRNNNALLFPYPYQKPKAKRKKS